MSNTFSYLFLNFLKYSLSEEQIDVFHKILDCVSNTAAAEMSTAYKVGFKDSVTLMIEVPDITKYIKWSCFC